MTTKLVLAMLVGTFAFTACSKKDDNDDTTAAPEETPDTTTPSTGTISLMNEIDVTCGKGTACFGSSSAALSLTGNGTALQTLQMFAWLSLGFPDSTSYTDTLGDKATDELKAMVPTNGFVGNIETVRKKIVDAAKEKYPDITKCADAPTSGSFDIDGGKVTWVEPSLKAPASFPATKAGKKYDKAVTYVATDGSRETRFEFFCDYNGMASVYKALKSGTQLAKYVFFYDRAESAKLYTDFYLLDKSSTISSGVLQLGVQLRSLSEGLMQVWVSRTGKDPDRGIQGYRYAVNADITNKKYSFFVLNNDAGYTSDEWAALETNPSTATTGGTAYASGNSSTNRLINGCTDSWDAETNGLTSAELCSGLSLEVAPAPALGTDGDSSLKWVDANLGDLIDAM